LQALKDTEAAYRVLDSNLTWLLTQDPEQLGAAQRQIAGMVRRAIGGGADLD
jgi:hypothetical protein